MLLQLLPRDSRLKQNTADSALSDLIMIGHDYNPLSRVHRPLELQMASSLRNELEPQTTPGRAPTDDA